MSMLVHDAARPLVSAIIPTRNRAHLLPRAIDSVLTQEGLGTQFDVELTVVDDASSDATSDVVRRYPAVRYIRLERQRGAAAARNAGIRASTGRYVAFGDDDDLWLPAKLRVQTAALEEHPEVGAVYGQSLVRKGQDEFLWPDISVAPSGSLFGPLLKMCFLVHPSMLLIRRGVFDTAGYFDEQLRTIEDYDLWLRIAFHFSFLFIPGGVAVYHASPHGLYHLSMANGTGADDTRRVMRKALQMLPEDRTHDETRRETHASTELHIALDKVGFSGPEERWRAALAASRAHPDILRYRWGRGTLATEACRLIVRSDSPIATASVLCRQLRAAAAGRGLTQWLRGKLASAAVWTAAAMELDWGPQKNIPAAGAAAARAIACDPSKLRVKALSWFMLRAALRPLAESIRTPRGRRGDRGTR
jgi:hypothetical protein